MSRRQAAEALVIRLMSASIAAPIQRYWRLSGAGSKAPSVGRGRLHRRHLEMRRQRRANPLYEAANVMLTRYKGQLQAQGLGLRNREAVNDAQGQGCSGAPPRNHQARDASRWDGVRARLSPASQETGGRDQLPRGACPREGADDGVDCVAGAFWPTAISTEPRCTQLTSSSAERARRERRHPKASTP